MNPLCTEQQGRIETEMQIVDAGAKARWPIACA